MSIFAAVSFQLRHVSSSTYFSAFVACRHASRPCSSYQSRSFHASPLAEKKSQATSGGGGIKTYKKKAPSLLRADRILSNRGVGTRSETAKLLKNKRIGQLDPNDPSSGKIVTIKGPSEKIHPKATLFLDGKELPGPPPMFLVYHKPKFVLSAMHDKEGRSHLGEKLAQCPHPQKNMHPVGRLDYETTGLILFSRSGDLTQRLLHPRRGVEKEYVATVEGDVQEESLRSMLSDGVETSEGVHEAKLLEVKALPVKADVELRNEGDGGDTDTEEAEATAKNLTDVRVVVTEGKHRMVRRMLANCGHPVVELKRERHGEIWLGNLSAGEFRLPTDSEIDWANSLLK